MAWYEFRPYVSAAEKRRRAEREIAKRRKKGLSSEPVVIEGRAIARTFWGKAWCDHLEQHCDFENRLPRGRTYVRGGAVLHLGIARGRVEALVQGTELYEVSVTVEPLSKVRWNAVVDACSGQIDSVVELLRGRLSSGVMKIVTHPKTGLFPAPAQIRVECSCPDSADMCKHVAAALYGAGARLDDRPELLFLLRGVDQADLLAHAGPKPIVRRQRGTARTLADDALSSVFGIEIDTGPVDARAAPPDAARPRRSAKAKTPTTPHPRAPPRMPRRRRQPV